LWINRFFISFKCLEDQNGKISQRNSFRKRKQKHISIGGEGWLKLKKKTPNSRSLHIKRTYKFGDSCGGLLTDQI
jgi:hypothetical protein